MKRLRKYQLWSMGSDKGVFEMLDEVEQPFGDWVRRKAIARADKVIYKVTPRKVWDWADERLIWWHVRKTGCQDDCVTGYRRLPGETIRDDVGILVPERDEAHEVKMCGRMPIFATWDCWVYDQMERGVKVKRTYVDVETAGEYLENKRRHRERREAMQNG